MTIQEAIQARHSVRQFKSTPIAEETAAEINRMIDEANADSGLHIQLVQDDPECFNTLIAHYGKFTNANNYIAIVGSKTLSDLEERGGYYGQKIVLAAQTMGLNTCWVGGSYGKGKCKADQAKGEKIVCVIAIGYGENSGKAHKSKPMEKLCSVFASDMPDWFRAGVEAAMQAPTALNQQKFLIDLKGDKPVITAKMGMMTKIDLGIVKYNFEAASGRKCS